MTHLVLGLGEDVVTKIKLGLTVLALVLGIASGGSCLQFSNTSIKMEAGIKAQYKDNQNVYDATWKKIRETASVADAHSEKVKEVIREAVQGRYGEGGAKAVFNVIVEQNPEVPTNLYEKVQQVIEASRNEFKVSQTMLVSKKEAYEMHLGVFPNSMYNAVLHYPSIDLNQYDIVTSEKTNSAFESKLDGAIDVFGNDDG